MSAPKDIKVAMRVQQMAAYGYFEEEFLFYCYAFQRGDDTVYKLSENKRSIYSAYHQSVFDDIYPTPVHSLLRNAVIPSGEQAVYKTTFKMELIEEMRKLYGPPFFEAMTLFSSARPTDAAFELLDTYLYRLSSQAEERQLYDGLCQQALEAKQLTISSYRTLIKNADRLYGKAASITVPLAGRGKSFSGFAYWPQPGGNIAHYLSATLEDTYSHYHQLRQTGLACSPIVQKSYWYPSPNSFKTVRSDFADFLIKLTNTSQIINLIEQIRALPPSVNIRRYQLWLSQLKDEATQEINTAFQGYGSRFNLLDRS